MTLPTKPTKADRTAAAQALAQAEQAQAEANAAMEAAQQTYRDRCADKWRATEAIQRLDAVEKLHKLPPEVAAALAGPNNASNPQWPTLCKRGLARNGYFSSQTGWTSDGQRLRALLGVE